MSQRMNEQKDQSMEERSWALLMEMWQKRETDRLEKELEEEETNGNTAEMDAFFEKYDAKNLQLIEKYARRARIRRFFKESLPHAARAAAVVIAVLFLVGATAFAASEEVRAYVLKLLINVTPEYTRLMFVEEKDDQNEFIVPEGWEGTGYPFKIPDGLILEEMHNGTSVHYVHYKGENGKFLEYSEITDGTLNVDSENAVSIAVEVNGTSGTMFEKDGRVTIYWYDGEILYIVETEGLTAEETLDIAAGVRKK